MRVHARDFPVQKWSSCANYELVVLGFKIQITICQEARAINEFYLGAGKKKGTLSGKLLFSGDFQLPLRRSGKNNLVISQDILSSQSIRHVDSTVCRTRAVLFTGLCSMQRADTF